MSYDIIFVIGEIYFDHPFSGTAILKRLLEKRGFKVGVIEKPTSAEEITSLGKPRLFFGISSGAIDSMVRNYTPLKKLRVDDENLDYNETVPDRAVIVYSNWIREKFKDSLMVLGGTEASLRRFVHYDYWDNKLRKPILFDSRADILVYGPAEKQIIEIAERLKEGSGIERIKGTCVIKKEIDQKFVELPSWNDVNKSKKKFCDMQMQITGDKNLVQKIDNRYLVQYPMPIYTTKDLDEYYGLPFTRKTPKNYPHLRGFEFSIVTHRGCIGECNFCAISSMHNGRIVSRSEESIIKEVERIVKLPYFKGNIDDLGGPSANMYGMDCNKCNLRRCLDCKNLDRSNSKIISLLRKVRGIKGVKNVFIKSGIRFDLATPEYIKEVAKHHIFDTLRIAPEHVNNHILYLMNKNRGNLKNFVKEFSKYGKELSYYYITGHPGSTIKEAKELANALDSKENISVQLFTPTPMTLSTCMYYTGMDPRSGKEVYVPYTYKEKKEQRFRL